MYKSSFVVASGYFMGLFGFGLALFCIFFFLSAFEETGAGSHKLVAGKKKKKRSCKERHYFQLRKFKKQREERSIYTLIQWCNTAWQIKDKYYHFYITSIELSTNTECRHSQKAQSRVAPNVHCPSLCNGFAWQCQWYQYTYLGIKSFYWTSKQHQNGNSYVKHYSYMCCTLCSLPILS